MLLALAVITVSGCRAVLGIDDEPARSDDAGAEAGEVAADADAPTGFCTTLSPPPQHCSDFEAGDLFAGWANVGKTPNPGVHGGAAFEERVEDDGRKLLARMPALVGEGQHAAANIQLLLPSLEPRISVHAKLEILTEEVPADSEVVLISLSFGEEGAVVVYRDREGGAAAVVPNGKAVRFPSWPPGQSRTINVVVRTIEGKDGWARFGIDSSYSPEIAIPAAFQKASRPRLTVGPTASAPMGEMKVTIDNVVTYWGAAE